MIVCVHQLRFVPYALRSCACDRIKYIKVNIGFNGKAFALYVTIYLGYIYTGEKTRRVGDSNLTCPPNSPAY